MNLSNIATRLAREGTVTFRAFGNSMVPLIKSGDTVTVQKVDPTTIEVGDIVLAKVSGRYYLHRVSAVGKGRVQISNAKGHVNGWTKLHNIFGIKI